MELKQQPNNIEAEQAILGAMFLNSGVIPKVQKIIGSDDFYREAHQQICQAIFELRKNSDLYTVSENLESKGLLKKCGGKDYLASLVEMTATSAGIENHCRIINNLSDRRKIIDQCSVAMDKAFNLTEPITETLSEHKAAIRAMNSTQGQDYLDNADIIKSVFNDIESRSKLGNTFVGVKTGFQNIDSNMQGLEPRTTNYIIARPSIGKTALALNIAEHVAQNDKGKVLFFSLESSNKALTRRRLAAHSQVFLSRLRTGDIDDSQWRDLIESADILSRSNLIIIDRPRFKKIENLVALTESLAMESPLSLIIIDHIQRMRSRRKIQSRHLELSHISEELSSLAHECNVTLNTDFHRWLNRHNLPPIFV